MRLLLALVLSLLTPAIAAAAPEPAARNACFNSSNWRGWSATPDGDTLYLRMNGGDIYRVQLNTGSRVRESAGWFLVHQVRGSNRICSALDLDLALADSHGFYRPLIATDLARLSPEEAAALPQEDRP